MSIQTAFVLRRLATRTVARQLAGRTLIISKLPTFIDTDQGTSCPQMELRQTSMLAIDREKLLCLPVVMTTARK
jgi:hypothetical protein